MLAISATVIDPSKFSPIQVGETLLEYDGPKIFTFNSPDGSLYLAHWCEEGDGLARYMVVPTSEARARKLLSGNLAVRPFFEERCYVLDVGENGIVKAGWSVLSGDLPEDYLPAAGESLV